MMNDDPRIDTDDDPWPDLAAALLAALGDKS
jgi:hypothetical protein